MSMSFKASPDGTFGEILVNGAVVAKLPITGNAVIPGLVGTVSQSGGVPTGAVVERGSNANGEYVRFADGTQICWVFLTAASPVRSADASITGLYYSDLSWSFPAAFSANPNVSGHGGDSVRRGWVSALTVTATAVTVVYFSSASAPASVSYRAIAIGRWY